MSRNNSYSNSKEHNPIWDVKALKDYFESKPDRSLKLNECTSIYSTKVFIESHLEIIGANNGNKTFEIYYLRLLELKSKINLQL